jgi:ribulose kinase
MNAGIAVGLFKDHEDAVRKMVTIEKVYRPNMDAARKYNKLFKVYQGIYQSVMNYWDLLHNIIEEEGLDI